MNTGSPVQNDVPKTPSSHGRQRTPMSSGGRMSSSLKERLKKCGRYHPATPPSSRMSNPTLSASQRQLPRKILVETTHLHENALLSDEATKVTHEISSASDMKECNKEFKKQSFSSTATCSNEPQSPFTIKIDSASNHRSLESPVITSDCSVAHSDHKVYEELNSYECLPASDCQTSQQHFQSNQSLGRSTKSETELQLEKHQLQVVLKERRETLRKLKMVKTYRKKNNLTELQVLIDKWRSACQQAVLDLHRLVPDPRPSLSQLVQQLGVDGRLVGFDEVEECFI